MKANRNFGAALGAALAILVAPMSQAEEVGEAEYVAACASCHGASGEGDGPLADLMTVEVPSLTGLSAANDGTFPMLDVIQVIDGRTGVRGHGYPMPVWGSRYKAEAMEAGEYAAEIEVRGRVLSLAMYIQSIQE
ncbi:MULTISPECIES: cytochrome c [unclassified Rhodosalinus]|uniref:c-type cytochrome n=1 Tax=unclassified Rhodosalinus TaxID=2630183 RepID=UPI0035239EC6